MKLAGFKTRQPTGQTGGYQAKFHCVTQNIQQKHDVPLPIVDKPGIKRSL